MALFPWPSPLTAAHEWTRGSWGTGFRPSPWTEAAVFPGEAGWQSSQLERSGTEGRTPGKQASCPGGPASGRKLAGPILFLSTSWETSPIKTKRGRNWKPKEIGSGAAQSEVTPNKALRRGTLAAGAGAQSASPGRWEGHPGGACVLLWP